LIKLRFVELAARTGGTLYNTYNSNRAFTGVSIDSRSVTDGMLFVAIRGERVDGHDYIDQAIDRGASGIVGEFAWPGLESIRGNFPVVGVADSHEAMISLAEQYRDSLIARFVGITGSNGKTTTKELAFSMIKVAEPHAFRSPGNLNNLFGVPLTLFQIPRETKVAIMELGISTPGEMDRLADMVHPDIIVMTNVGPSHLQFLSSVEEVARAKLELVRRADASVPVILNADDPVLMSEAKKIRSDYITFALDNEADYTVDDIAITDNGATAVTIDGRRFLLPLIGRHQVSNLLAAYAAFATLGYSFEGVDTEAIRFDTPPMRGQRVTKHDMTFIADCYNANPESVRAGLAAFFEMTVPGRRVVILGDMLELGEKSRDYHREAGERLAQYDFDLAITVGPLSQEIISGAIAQGNPKNIFHHFDNSHDAADAVRALLHEGDFVYLKGSRGIELENVLNVFDDSEEQG